MNYFERYNPNPNPKRKTNDCVVRAMCKALNSDWDTVYKDLTEIGFRLKTMPNEDTTWKEYLTAKGYYEVKIPVTKGTTRPRVWIFTKDHPTGTFILKTANHILTVVNGKYYDTWDSGNKSVYHYWEKIT